ncbi:type II toxin-antitoxin system YafQ family toxin [uncultured Succinivibrio sp.]|uniref:type II toxin-antitoxin system YafQ family toxin n=1 Tax=uncultured Succinivibrio sp. TaxID=540749 RepID=UPI003446C4C9
MKISMYTIYFTKKMKKDLKRMRKRGINISELTTVLEILSSGQELSEGYRDHQLSGDKADFRECHIDPDWLLIYRIENDKLILTATETGSHADLFGM